MSRVKLYRKRSEGKCKLLRVGGRFELWRVRVTGIRLVRVQLHTLKTTGPQKPYPVQRHIPLMQMRQIRSALAPHVFFTRVFCTRCGLCTCVKKTNGNAKQGFPQINIFETFKLFRYPLLQTSLGQFTTAMRFFPPNDILYRQVK